MYYVISHHGTAGFDWSYGYSEVWELDEAPRGDMTRSVFGPFETLEAAEAECARLNAEQDKVRARL